MTSSERKQASAAPPADAAWRGRLPRLDWRDRRFKCSLRRQIVLAASARQGTEVVATEQKEVVVAFEYQQRTRGRDPRRRWGRRQRILLGLQAATLMVVAAGVLVVSRPPADQRPTAHELLGRALRALDVHPSGVVVHQVVTESGLGQSWLDLSGSPIVPNLTTSSGTPQVITVTGSGFSPNGNVIVAFNAPYAVHGAPAARGTKPIQRVVTGVTGTSGQVSRFYLEQILPDQSVDTTIQGRTPSYALVVHTDGQGRIVPSAPQDVPWAFDPVGNLFNPGQTAQTTLPKYLLTKAGTRHSARNGPGPVRPRAP